MDANKLIIEKYKPHGELPSMFDGSRWHDFPYLFKELGFKVGAEIGVEVGRYAHSLITKVGGKLYCIDPWIFYEDQNGPEEFYQETIKRLADHNVEIIRKFSVDAVKDFEDESLDYVFIDANHNYKYCFQDIGLWYPKVKKGGILSGHDFTKAYGVKQAVIDWTQQHNISPWFAMYETKKLGNPCWLFVK